MSYLLGIMDFGLELSKKYRVLSTLVFLILFIILFFDKRILKKIKKFFVRVYKLSAL